MAAFPAGWRRQPTQIRLPSLLLLLFLLLFIPQIVAVAMAASTSTATTSPTDDPPEGGKSNALELAVSDATETLNLDVVVVPLTSGMGRGQLSHSVRGFVDSFVVPAWPCLLTRIIY